MADATSEDQGAAALDAGWADLAGGRWAAALACFERAVASEETAEAHEGLSWAAWWLDDADVVFAARDRAYRLYKQRGDRAAAARVATWLACDELDFHGASAVASGWLGRARRLLGELEPGPEHGWLAFFEGYIASGAGDSDRAIELAVEAAGIGRRLEVPDLEMLGLALEGATLVACAHVDEGMRRLDEATAAALEGEADVAIAGAWACCFLVTACSAVRDYERASEWCDRIAEFAERYGSTEAATCSRSAGPSTAGFTSGAGAGARRRRYSKRRSRTSPDRDPRWSAARWRRWPSFGAARDVPRKL